MKRITKITLVVLALAGVGGLAVFGVPAAVKADDDSNTVSYDVACDCRTGATLDGGVRGSPFMIEGKIFPPGTLPSGNASNDPTLPVNGHAPIGDWLCRGQSGGGVDTTKYGSVPFAFNTQYFILDVNGGQVLPPASWSTLTTEGYDVPNPRLGVDPGGLLSITGGIGSFSGASGDLQGVPIGTNITGCPNFRAKFNLRPGSVHAN